MSNFKANITLDAGDETKAIFDSIHTDNEFYPENSTKTKITIKNTITIHIESDQIPSLRANLNSTLRLLQTSYDAIRSVKI